MTLLGDFGPVVCKFGPEALKPVLQQTISILLKQTPEQLARLPALADTLTSINPATLAVSVLCKRALHEEEERLTYAPNAQFGLSTI